MDLDTERAARLRANSAKLAELGLFSAKEQAVKAALAVPARPRAAPRPAKQKAPPTEVRRSTRERAQVPCGPGFAMGPGLDMGLDWGLDWGGGFSTVTQVAGASETRRRLSNGRQSLHTLTVAPARAPPAGVVQRGRGVQGAYALSPGRGWRKRGAVDPGYQPPATHGGAGRGIEGKVSERRYRSLGPCRGRASTENLEDILGCKGAIVGSRAAATVSVKAVSVCVKY